MLVMLVLLLRGESVSSCFVCLSPPTTSDAHAPARRWGPCGQVEKWREKFNPSELVPPVSILLLAMFEVRFAFGSVQNIGCSMFGSVRGSIRTRTTNTSPNVL